MHMRQRDAATTPLLHQMIFIFEEHGMTYV